MTFKCDCKRCKPTNEVIVLRRLVLELGERLYIVAQHLGKLAERKEVRGR